MSQTESKTLNFNEKDFEKGFEKFAKKIRDKAKKENLNIDKQFFLDVLSGNYRIKGKNGAILIAATIYLVVPKSRLTVYIFGPLAFLVDGALGFLDEVLVIAKIIDIIQEENIRYQDFTSKRGYKPATLINPLKINIGKSFEELINCLNSEKKTSYNDEYSLVLSQHVKSLKEYINYETQDYKYIIREYISLENIKSADGFVKIDTSKIKKMLAFPEGFDEKLCIDIMQNQMDDELEGGGKLNVYKLSTLVMLDRSYLLPSKGMTDIAYDKLSYVDYSSTRSYDLSHLKFDLELLLIIVNEIRALENETIQTILYKLNMMIIEVNIALNYQVQVITDDVSMINVASQLEDQLTIFMKKYRSVRILPLPTHKELIEQSNEIDIDQQIQIAINRIYTIGEDTSIVTFKHNNFLEFVPLYNKKFQEQYISNTQKNFKITYVDNEKVEIRFDDTNFTTNKIESFNIKPKANFVMMKKCIPGQLTTKHILEILDSLFFVQDFTFNNQLLNIVVSIDCSNGLIVQVQFDKDCQVRIIDAKAQLTTRQEDNIEKILNKEIKSNIKLLKKYKNKL